VKQYYTNISTYFTGLPPYNSAFPSTPPSLHHQPSFTLGRHVVTFRNLIVINSTGKLTNNVCSKSIMLLSFQFPQNQSFQV